MTLIEDKTLRLVSSPLMHESSLPRECGCPLLACACVSALWVKPWPIGVKFNSGAGLLKIKATQNESSLT